MIFSNTELCCVYFMHIFREKEVQFYEDDIPAQEQAEK